MSLSVPIEQIVTKKYNADYVICEPYLLCLDMFMVEENKRSIGKTISWRIVATTTTMIVVYIFTGELLLSLGVGVVEASAKMVFYYLHERAWNKIKWGKV
jgi:uncharacterized membrane protein